MHIAAQRNLAASLLLSFAFAGSAQEATTAVVAERQANAAPSAEVAGNKDRRADRHCLRATGSRIVTVQKAASDKGGQRCAIGPGRVHTSEDLERTGASSLGDALRRLEPSSR